MTSMRSARVEALESRELFSFVPHGFTPAQIRHAYGFDAITFQSRKTTIAGDGSGQTIAVVDAYDDPYIYTDLKSFDHAFHIGEVDSTGQFALTKVRPQGTTPPDAGWALEESLDVEWAHAIAPRAHILLVEAKSDSISDLLSAVDYARRQSGISTISLSWGGDEFPTESTYDSHLLTPSGHIGGAGLRGGITFFTASGDNGAPAGWPAVSPNVVAVGGTSLYLDKLGNYKTEKGWSGSGGGISQYETSLTSAPAVAYAADPNTGVAVFDSYMSGTLGQWSEIGGTSVGSPQWAALLAITDQGRALLGKGSLETQQTLNGLFRLPSTDFHSIVTGNNGGYSAGPGFNLVTGLGTPFADRVVRDLVRL